MAKILQILQHEVVTLVSRFSFWFGLLGIPLIGLLLFAGVGWINRSQGGSDDASSPFTALLEPDTDDTRPYGIVDESGIVQAFPEDIDSRGFVSYATTGEARADLEAGTIRAYYRIPADYLESGELNVVTPEFDLLNAGDQSSSLRWMIEYNLLRSDPALAQAVRNPLVQLEEENLSPQASSQRDPDSELSFFLPYGAMMLFYITIMSASGMLLNSVTKEKENRILEVLMSSVTAQQMLLGKVAGLGLVGLLQVVVWSASALTLLRLGGQTFNWEQVYQLPTSILAWGVVFFLFGYLVYASLMAGVGALVPSLREGSQATIVVVLPMMVPLFLISALIGRPNGPIAVGLSLFPFTAPTTMMLRLAATDVPLWQLLLSVALLAVTTFLVIRAVAGMFRAQTLLSGQAFNLRRYFAALFGRG